MRTLIALFLSPLVLAAAPPSDNVLDAFAPLVGHCWEGMVAENALNVHCWDAVYGGAHIRDRHQVMVQGKVVYSGETIYSREANSVRFTYWNSLGGGGTGTGSADDNGACFEGMVRATPDAALQPSANCFIVKAEGGYVMTRLDGEPVRFTRSTQQF